MAAYLRTLTITSRRARKRLEWHRDHDPKPYVRERCAAILKIAEGLAPHAVARVGLLKLRDPDTIYAWLTAYEEDGCEGLVQHPPGGYRGPSLAVHRTEVEDRLQQPPTEAQLASGATTPALAPCPYRLALVRASFDWLADYTPSGVWRVLHRLGIGWKHGYINYWSPIHSI